MDKRAYKHFPERPLQLTADFAKANYISLTERIDDAEKDKTPESWLKLYYDWNELSSYVGSEGGRIYHRYSKNMDNVEAEAADKYFREMVTPVIYEPEHTLATAFLKSAHRQSIADKFGQRLISVYETALKPLDPVNAQLRVEAGNLSKSYDKLCANASIIIQGKPVTLWVARTSLTRSDDPTMRKEAYQAAWDWHLDHQSELADIFDKLVKLRHQMGKNVGYDSFIPLAYEQMGRTDYTPVEAKQFRDNVIKHIVPVHKIISAAQANALNKSTLAPWDMLYDPRSSLPIGSVPVDTQLDKAQKMFDRLSPRLGGYFKTMRERDLIDLQNRPGKRSGAYMTEFSDEEAVAVFLNSTGDDDDVRVLTHEMGHAFQGWESQWIEAVELQQPTADLCEVHSMGMEFLSLGYIDEFFDKPSAKKFKIGQWQDAVYTLAYVAMVDDFQHWVYANHSASTDERDDYWGELTNIYLPGIDYRLAEKYRKSRWYGQMHIFDIPFYYLDYALAQTGAMQLGMLDEIDHPLAMKRYMDLCHIGGTKSLLDGFSSAGLRSPFDESLMIDLMSHVSKSIGI